jgi:hypothetical protein
MSGGQVNDAEGVAYSVHEAVDYAGLILTYSATADHADLCAASSSEPIGYTFTDKKHPITGLSQTNQRVTCMALIEGRFADLQLPATHEAISVGEEIMSTTAGKVVPKSGGAAWVIGRATESVSQNTGGTVEVRISKRYSTT